MTNQPTPAERGLPELRSLPVGIAARLSQTQRDALAQYVLEHGRACYEAALSARPLPSDWVAVPRGWKLVPVEPTDDMIWAGRDAWAAAHNAMRNNEPRSPMTETWAALLEAAPSAPAEGCGACGDGCQSRSRCLVEEQSPPVTAPEPLAQGDELNLTPEELATWLDRKFARHGEDEDRQAAAMIRKLYASPQPAADVQAPAQRRSECEPVAVAKTAALWLGENEKGERVYATSFKWLKEPQEGNATIHLYTNPPQPSASVGERARELLVSQYLHSGMSQEKAERLTAHVQATQPEALRAIEQAMTQQNTTAAEHWHGLYRKECRLRQDDAARYGQQIVDLESALTTAAGVGE